MLKSKCRSLDFLKMNFFYGLLWFCTSLDKSIFFKRTAKNGCFYWIFSLSIWNLSTLLVFYIAWLKRWNYKEIYLVLKNIHISIKSISTKSKQFTYMHLKGLVTHFQKMVLFIMLWLTVLEIRVLSRRILLNFCWVGIFLNIFIDNNSWTVAQTPINHIIFSKSIMRTFWCIYVNSFNRLRKNALFWTIQGP